jgi:hypothetical protein
MAYVCYWYVYISFFTIVELSTTIVTFKKHKVYLRYIRTALEGMTHYSLLANVKNMYDFVYKITMLKFDIWIYW